MTAGLGGPGLGAADNGYRISAGADKMSWNLVTTLNAQLRESTKNQ